MQIPATKVAIVDYSLGNLFSVQNACAQVGLQAEITSDKNAILAARAVILPGVGAFGDAMDNLRRLDLIGPLRDLAARGTPLIGVCLGQQLLMSESHEFGRHRGLGIFEGEVIRFDKPRGPEGTLKVPQVGWNRIHLHNTRLGPASVSEKGSDPLESSTISPMPGDSASDRARGLTPFRTLGPLDGLADGEFMYFVHSFHVVPVSADVVMTTTRYGHIEFCSSLRRGNVVAFQFHPERSGQEGLRIYQNLAAMITNQDNQECRHAA